MTGGTVLLTMKNLPRWRTQNDDIEVSQSKAPFLAPKESPMHRLRACSTLVEHQSRYTSLLKTSVFRKYQIDIPSIPRVDPTLSLDLINPLLFGGRSADPLVPIMR